MAYNTLLESIINEQAIRPEEVKTYGSNISKYDDGKIGYNSVIKSYFIVFAVKDGFVAVAISRVDGTIRYTFSKNAYIGRMLHQPALMLRKAVVEALNYLPQILFCIMTILKPYNMRIPRIKLVSTFTLQDKYNKFLINSPTFKMMVKKYRFTELKSKVDKIQGKEVTVHTIEKK